MDRKEIKDLKEFIKMQKEIEKKLTKEQIIIRRLYHPDGETLQQLIEIIWFHNNKMDLG